MIVTRKIDAINKEENRLKKKHFDYDNQLKKYIFILCNYKIFLN